MSEIISPRLWNRKPPAGAVINYGHPLAEGILMAHLFNEFGGSFQWDYERGKVFQFIDQNFLATTGGHSWVSGNDEHGPAVSCGINDGFSLGFAGEAEAAIPTDRVTILVIRRKSDATNNRASALFGLQTSTTAALRCGAHVPWSDGNIYFDFGGTASPNRLTISGITFNQQLEKWAFVAGGRGSSVWRNSVKLGSQSTAVTRTQSPVNSNLLCLNSGNGSTSPGDVQEIYFFAAFAAEWTDDMVQWWMDEPYAMFVPPSPRAIYAVPELARVLRRNVMVSIST